MCCCAQVLSNLAWSFAKLGYFEQGLWNALASSTMANADQLRSAELAQLTWAFCQAIADQAANDGIGGRQKLHWLALVGAPAGEGRGQCCHI